MLWGGDEGCGTIVAVQTPMERPMKRNDLSRSLVAFNQASTMVVRMWLELQGLLVQI